MKIWEDVVVRRGNSQLLMMVQECCFRKNGLWDCGKLQVLLSAQMMGIFCIVFPLLNAFPP